MNDPFTIEEIEESIGFMRKRLESEQGDLHNAMCRLSLPMSEFLLKELKTMTAMWKGLKGALDKRNNVLMDIAEHDCSYGDNCPTFGANHYQCIPCKAKEGLK